MLPHTIHVFVQNHRVGKIVLFLIFSILSIHETCLGEHRELPDLKLMHSRRARAHPIQLTDHLLVMRSALFA